MQLFHHATIKVSPSANVWEPKTHDIVNKLAFFHGLKHQLHDVSFSNKNREMIFKKFEIKG